MEGKNINLVIQAGLVDGAKVSKQIGWPLFLHSVIDNAGQQWPPRTGRLGGGREERRNMVPESQQTLAKEGRLDGLGEQFILLKLIHWINRSSSRRQQEGTSE